MTDVAAISALKLPITGPSPTFGGSGQIVAPSADTSATITGVTPSYLMISNLTLSSGTFITDDQVAGADGVVVLGNTLAKTLFGSGAAVGQNLRVAGRTLRVIGVLNLKGSSGFGSVNGGALGSQMGAVFYFAPDSCQWECLDFGYSQFIGWSLQGELAKFYESLRWPGWEDEIATLEGDQAIFIFPFPSTKGPPLEQRHHGVVPIAEMFGLYISGDAAPENPSSNS